MNQQLLETDQCRCYSQEGRKIACDGTGQDGSSEKRINQAVHDRFQVLDHVVEDRLTSAIWSRDADRPGGRLSWQDALSAVQSMNAEKPDVEQDWRLPNIRELESLVDLESHSPALPAGHPFVNVRDAYWTSTTSVYEPRYAWTVYTQDGIVGVGFKPQAVFYVWPVRKG